MHQQCELFGIPPGHLAFRSPSQLGVVCLTLVDATCSGVRLAVLHGEVERVPVVFDAIYNPDRRDEMESMG